MVEPTTVDLRTIPAGVYDPNNQFDRWQRGEIDLTENELWVEVLSTETLDATQIDPSTVTLVNAAGKNASTTVWPRRSESRTGWPRVPTRRPRMRPRPAHRHRTIR